MIRLVIFIPERDEEKIKARDVRALPLVESRGWDGS